MKRKITTGFTLIIIIILSACRVYKGEDYNFACDDKHTEVKSVVCNDGTTFPVNERDASLCAGHEGVDYFSCKPYWHDEPFVGGK